MFWFLEQLQIANYGIGGHYEPHFDHASDHEDKFTDLGLGNRIATILYYVRTWNSLNILWHVTAFHDVVYSVVDPVKFFFHKRSKALLLQIFRQHLVDLFYYKFWTGRDFLN